jgi:hypothetical protein
MLNENIVTVGEVSEMFYNAKEEAKYAHLLEGFTYRRQPVRINGLMLL